MNASIVNYPLLSQSEQSSLPLLISSPVEISPKFADSTHRLWYCETAERPAVLKVCDHTSVNASSFWLGMNHLFGIDFPSYLGGAQNTAQYLNKHGAFVVPEVIAAQDQRFVLVAFIAGMDHEAELVNDKHIVQLAQHIGQLHQQRFDRWGDVHTPVLPPKVWSVRLAEALKELAQSSSVDIPKTLLEDILTEAHNIEASDFVPIMPDLRWDQLRRLENSDQLALIDLDAFVIGPRALELVLILYLLTPAQLSLFKQTYCKLNDWPDFAAQKRSYQLLLFLMNVLGETDLTRWMARV